jgi:hypothetical protein
MTTGDGCESSCTFGHRRPETTLFAFSVVWLPVSFDPLNSPVCCRTPSHSYMRLARSFSFFSFRSSLSFPVSLFHVFSTRFRLPYLIFLDRLVPGAQVKYGRRTCVSSVHFTSVSHRSLVGICISKPDFRFDKQNPVLALISSGFDVLAF